jgi:hypothetical protein
MKKPKTKVKVTIEPMPGASALDDNGEIWAKIAALDGDDGYVCCRGYTWREAKLNVIQKYKRYLKRRRELEEMQPEEAEIEG